MSAKTPEARARQLEGARRGGEVRSIRAKAEKAEGMAWAVHWRESRRCHCGSLAYQSCEHRPEGLAA